MDVRRVALIYDDTLRPETSGTYCRRALGGLVEVEHVLPTRLGDLARTGYDLYLNVDHGLPPTRVSHYLVAVAKLGGYLARLRIEPQSCG